MLQALVAYAEREKLGDADFETVGVRWLVPLNFAGTLVGDPIPLTENPADKYPKPKRLKRPKSDPDFVSHGRAYFLCDTLERCLVMVDEEAKREKRGVNQAYFIELIEEASKSCRNTSSDLAAVARFLRNPAGLATLHAKLRAAKAKTSENATFAVEGRMLLDSQELQHWWRARNLAQSADGDLGESVCLVTGSVGPICRTTGFIKLLGDDTKLISFNQECPAFESYGLAQAANAPVSKAAETKFSAALNALIEKSRQQRLVFNETIHLHWTRDAIVRDPFDLLAEPDERAVEALINSVKAGRPRAAMNTQAYYAASLSANGARIVVRNWLESSVQEVEAHVARWFEDLALVDPDEALVRRGFTLWGLLATLVPSKAGKPDLAKLAPQAAADLLLAAMNGGALPLPILYAAVRRQQLDENKLNQARLALIKACLIRSPNRKDTDTMTDQLDPTSKDTAYLCGQLFAVIGRLQLLALGKVGASIAERTYGGVATRPATTLGPIFTKLPAYLKKANVRFPGSGTNKQKEIEVLCQQLEGSAGIPRILGLEEQGRFALGYYCQLAQYRRSRTEEDAAKKAEELQADSD